MSDYINRLEHYDGPEIAQVALGDDYKMYEEAVLIYQKSEMDDSAMDVIIDRIGSLERAAEFAARSGLLMLIIYIMWTKLGRELNFKMVQSSLKRFNKILSIHNSCRI